MDDYYHYYYDYIRSDASASTNRNMTSTLMHRVSSSTSSNTIVSVTVPWTISATVQPRMDQQQVNQLCECEDDYEGLHHPQPPPPVPSYVYLLASQPVQRDTHKKRTSTYILAHKINWMRTQEIKVFNLIYPKARAVTAQAMADVAPADAKLSLLHALMWFPPRNFDIIPRTAASMENVKKNMVAPFPPKPEFKAT